MTQKSKKSSSSMPSKSRKPRHCRKCAGNPILQECAHSPAGRAYLLNIAAKRRPTVSNEMSVVNLLPPEASVSSAAAASSYVPAIDPSLLDNLNDNLAANSPSPIRVPGPFHAAVIAMDLIGRSASDILIGTSLATIAGSSIGTSVSSNNFITPRISSHDLTTGNTPSSFIGTSVIDKDFVSPRSSIGPGHDSTPLTVRGTTSDASRVRVSNANPVYEFVQGAKRGNDPFPFPRTHALRPPLTDTSTSTRRFLRTIKDIISRCEQVSHETGCWLFLATQHANSTSPFIHYTSPRLRRESKLEVADIATEFNKLFGSLVAARRQDAKDLHLKLLASQDEQIATMRELSKVRDEQKSAEMEAESVRQNLIRAQTENAQQAAMLSRLKARLGIE